MDCIQGLCLAMHDCFTTNLNTCLIKAKEISMSVLISWFIYLFIAVPCLAKKTQEVTPEVKEKGRYYVDKYVTLHHNDMSFNFAYSYLCEKFV